MAREKYHLFVLFVGREKNERNFRTNKESFLKNTNLNSGFTWKNIIQQVVEMYLSCSALFNSTNYCNLLPQDLINL